MPRRRRNIARKTKATKANRTIPVKRDTEPFALAEGHTTHSEPIEPLRSAHIRPQTGAKENYDPSADTTPSASDAMRHIRQLDDGASEAPRLSPQGDSMNSPGRSEHSERQPGERQPSEARPPQPPLAQNAPGAKVNEPLPELHHRAPNAIAGFVPLSTRGNGDPNPASPRRSHSGSDNCKPTTDSCTATRNRQNAHNSTGPRTAEGKAASSRNAFKHGLSIQRHVILEHEDPADYEQLLNELREIYEPQSGREDLCVEDIAQCRWALRRFDEGESRLMEYHFAHQASTAFDADDRVTYGEALGYSCLQEPGEPRRPEYPSFLLLQRYRAHWDRRHQRALAEFDRAQRARRAEAAEERKQAEDRRRQELHELKVAIAQTKFAEAQAVTAAKQAKSKEAAFFHALEKHLNTPPPGLPEHELASLGFVSSTQTNPGVKGRARKSVAV